MGVAARFFTGKRLVVKVVTSGSYGDAARLKATAGGAWVAAHWRAPTPSSKVLNEEARAEMLALGVDAERITLVPNGVEIPATPSTQRGPDFLFCGRLVPQKNVDGLLRGPGPARPAVGVYRSSAKVRCAPHSGARRRAWHPRQRRLWRPHRRCAPCHRPRPRRGALLSRRGPLQLRARGDGGVDAGDRRRHRRNADLVRHETTGLLVAPATKQRWQRRSTARRRDEQLRARLGGQARRWSATSTTSPKWRNESTRSTNACSAAVPLPESRSDVRHHRHIFAPGRASTPNGFRSCTG